MLAAFIPRNHDGQVLGNYNSSQGMPQWTFLLAAAILGYIIIRVWSAIKKDE